MKTKKFNEFFKKETDSNSEKRSDKVTKIINEEQTSEELKKSAEKIGLDLTKNLSKRIDLI